MNIHFYGYNAFLVQTKDKTIAIDPGALFCYWFQFTPLIPKSRWRDITHIFVTHGDPDHYWHADRVARASGAKVVLNKTMLRTVNGKNLALGPRSKGLTFNTEFNNLRTLSVNEVVEIDGMSVTGVKTSHGELVLTFGPFKKCVRPGPEERIGWGSIGFDINVHGKRILNFGDTMLHETEWEQFVEPDVLMIPIGGRYAHNTMNEDEALIAVQMLRPKLTIPCHYNCPGFFSKQLNPADDQAFKQKAESLGFACRIMRAGDSIDLKTQ